MRPAEELPYEEVPVARDERLTMPRLRRFNLAMAALHAGQGVAMLVVASEFALPVTAAFVEPDLAGTVLEPRLRELFTLRIAPLVAAFLFLSAAAHLWLSTAGYRRYGENLERHINPVRWIEYSASSSVMIVVVAMLAGMYDVAALLLLFALNATMILLGWMMEKHNQTTTRTDWTAFGFGTFAGIVPWVAVGIYLAGAGGESGGPPGFVYGIYASIFAFFNVFAINMILQYRGKGRWRDYVYGEGVYIVLSLFAKSALAWQVFAGTLRPV